MHCECNSMEVSWYNLVPPTSKISYCRLSFGRYCTWSVEGALTSSYLLPISLKLASCCNCFLVLNCCFYCRFGYILCMHKGNLLCNNSLSQHALSFSAFVQVDPKSLFSEAVDLIATSHFLPDNQQTVKPSDWVTGLVSSYAFLS